MKKILTLTIIALFALILMATNVQAAEVATGADFNTALAGTDKTIVLKENITLNAPLEITRDVTIDLNGHTITPANGFSGGDYMVGVHRQAHLTIKDSGSNGKISNKDKELVVVKMTVAGESDDTHAAKFTLESGMLENLTTGYATISGNGKRHNTEVVINGGTVYAKDEHAIYQPQDGKITVNGGTIEGKTGIEIRSGNLIVTGGTIIGTGIPVTAGANGNGATTVGAGIAVAQHTTEKNIKVVVDGGNIQGYAALYESNPQSNTTTDKVVLEINDGKFEAINGGRDAVFSEDKKDFITGGTFSSDVSSYIDSNSNIGAVEDEEGNIYVGTVHTITVEKAENGKVTASKSEAVVGQVVTLTVTPEEGYKLATLKVNGKDVVDGKFVMPDEVVTVEATFEKIAVEEDEEKDPVIEDDKEEEKDPVVEDNKKEEKDETPDTGVETAVTAFAVVALISLAGLTLIRRKNK